MFELQVTKCSGSSTSQNMIGIIWNERSDTGAFDDENITSDKLIRIQNTK